MPEGHTIHRLAQDHNKAYAGQKLKLSSPQGRFSKGAKRLNEKKLQRVEAHGKHLFYHWERSRAILHVHLGLYGKFRTRPVPPPAPVGAVRLRAVGLRAAFDLNGPNTCELLNSQECQAILSRLGPDPLRNDANPERVWDRIRKSRAAIGTLLLNQSVIAGVGNVYRSEVLHLLQIHPERPGNELSRDEFEKLWTQLVELLQIGVKYNRIIVADPSDVGKARSRMNRNERLLIYKHSKCGRCDGAVVSWELGARKIFACERCQS